MLLLVVVAVLGVGVGVGTVVVVVVVVVVCVRCTWARGPRIGQIRLRASVRAHRKPPSAVYFSVELLFHNNQDSPVSTVLIRSSVVVSYSSRNLTTTFSEHLTVTT